MSALPPPPRTSHHACRFAAVLLVISFVPLCAQVDTIRARPGAVQLRSIWSQQGGGTGNAVASLWDMNGDGRDEFAVADLGGDWRIFSLDSLRQASVLWQYPARAPLPLIHGDFRGDGRRMLVYTDRRDTAILGSLYWLKFFEVDSGRVADSSTMTWHCRIGTTRLLGPEFRVTDLDRDGADELIISTQATVRDGVGSHNGEIWIYRGGREFNVDEPVAVIRDAKVNGDEYSLHIGLLDDDEYPDLVVTTFTGGRIRWGGPNLSSLDRPVDREFVMASARIHLLDADGDGWADILSKGPPDQIMLHLSSSGKDPRTRGFDVSDADRTFVGRGSSTFVLGPLNDSADRFDMFGTNSAMADLADLMFSGGVDGPDANYDARYTAREDGQGSGNANQRDVRLGDVDGNGWRDHLMGSMRFGGDRGIAVVLGGGPHIPRDSMPLSAIRDIEVDGRRAAITVWPNPASEIVHVAWRGDVKCAPARFAVHDVLGRLVAHGDADRSRGEVVWHCVDRPAGAYLLSIFGADGELIASTIVTLR